MLLPQVVDVDTTLVHLCWLMLLPWWQMLKTTQGVYRLFWQMLKPIVVDGITTGQQLF